MVRSGIRIFGKLDIGLGWCDVVSVSCVGVEGEVDGKLECVCVGEFN